MSKKSKKSFNLIQLFDSLSGDYQRAIADTLVEGIHKHSTKEVIDALRKAGYWSHLADLFEIHLYDSEKTKAFARYMGFNIDEKIALARAIVAGSPSDGGVTALALAESSGDKKTIREMTDYVVANARTLSGLEVAVQHGSDSQIAEVVDTILDPSCAADGYLRPICNLLKEQVKDPVRLEGIVVESVSLLIKNDKEDKALSLASSSGNQEALMRIFFDDRVYFIEALIAGFSLRDRPAYKSLPSQYETIDRGIRQILDKAEIDKTWMETLTQSNLLLRAAKVSGNYKPFENYVYETLEKGELKPAKKVIDALPDLKLDNNRLDEIAGKLLNWKERIENIPAEVYIAGLTGQPLDRNKLWIQIAEHLPSLSTSENDHIGCAVAGFEYLRKQPGGLSNNEKKISTYVKTLMKTV